MKPLPVEFWGILCSLSLMKRRKGGGARTEWEGDTFLHKRGALDGRRKQRSTALEGQVFEKSENGDGIDTKYLRR